MRLLLFLEESAGIQALRVAHASQHEVVAVLTTQEQHGTKPMGATVAKVADHLGIPVWPAEQVKKQEFAEQVERDAIDLILNVHSLHIVHPDVLSAARLGAINLHPGPLPSYAGINVVNWAIMNGESHHGTTLHWMESGIDTGDIVFEKRFELPSDATGLSISRQCTKDGLELIQKLLETDPNSIPRQPQDPSQRRYYSRELPFTGGIPWHQARLVERFVRACNFYPLTSPWGVPTVTHEGESIGLMKVAVTDQPCHDQPGQLQLRNQSCFLSTGDYWIRVSMLLYRNRLVTPEAAFFDQPTSC